MLHELLRRFLVLEDHPRIGLRDEATSYLIHAMEQDGPRKLRYPVSQDELLAAFEVFDQDRRIVAWSDEEAPERIKYLASDWDQVLPSVAKRGEEGVMTRVLVLHRAEDPVGRVIEDLTGFPAEPRWLKPLARAARHGSSLDYWVLGANGWKRWPTTARVWDMLS